MLDFWRDLLGQNVIELDDLDAVCETIALTVGLGEDAIDLDEGLRRPGRGRLDAAGTVSQGAGPRSAAARRAGSPTLPAVDADADRRGRPGCDEHVVVVDLGYGDAGKGTVVDWLCATRPVHTVVRFNGGAQAAHNVVTARRAAPHVRAVRRRARSARACRPTCPGSWWSTRWRWPPRPTTCRARRHRRARPADGRRGRAARHAVPPGRQPGPGDARGADRHGSCGMGVGETVAYALAHPDDAPRVGRLPLARRVLRRRLTALRDRLTAELGPLDAPPVDDVPAPRSPPSPRGCAIVDGSYLAGAAARRDRASSRARRGCCWTSGTASTRTRRGPPRRSPTPRPARRGGPAGARSGSACCGRTPPGTAPGPLVTEDPALPLPDPHNGDGPVAGRVPVRALRRGRPPVRPRGGRRRRRAGRSPTSTCAGPEPADLPPLRHHRPARPGPAR